MQDRTGLAICYWLSTIAPMALVKPEVVATSPGPVKSRLGYVDDDLTEMAGMLRR